MKKILTICIMLISINLFSQEYHKIEWVKYEKNDILPNALSGGKTLYHLFDSVYYVTGKGYDNISYYYIILNLKVIDSIDVQKANYFNYPGSNSKILKSDNNYYYLTARFYESNPKEGDYSFSLFDFGSKIYNKLYHYVNDFQDSLDFFYYLDNKFLIMSFNNNITKVITNGSDSLEIILPDANFYKKYPKLYKQYTYLDKSDDKIKVVYKTDKTYQGIYDFYNKTWDISEFETDYFNRDKSFYSFTKSNGDLIYYLVDTNNNIYKSSNNVRPLTKTSHKPNIFPGPPITDENIYSNLFGARDNYLSFIDVIRHNKNYSHGIFYSNDYGVTFKYSNNGPAGDYFQHNYLDEIAIYENGRILYNTSKYSSNRVFFIGSVLPLSIDEVTKKFAYIYPNPVSDFVLFGTDEGLGDYELYGMMGNLVLSGNTQNNYLNLGSLQSGIYFIKSSNSGKIYYDKIIKD